MEWKPNKWLAVALCLFFDVFDRHWAGPRGCPPNRVFPGTAPAGHYFVLGDNRDNSIDSRMFGFVPASHVVGKVVVISRPVP